DLNRVGDGLAIDQDGAAVNRVAREQRARVASVCPKGIGSEYLDDGSGEEEAEEHDEHDSAHALEFFVHERAPAPLRTGSLSMTSFGPVRTESDNRNSRATMIQLATSDEPPAARNGVVRPVSGMTLVTPPM